jgi:DNA gyrase inhibitor GyrI
MLGYAITRHKSQGAKYHPKWWYIFVNLLHEF